MKRIRILFVIVLAFALQQTAFADVPDNDESQTKFNDLHTPEVSSKQHKALTEYMLNQARQLVKMGYKVQTDRNGEVIVVTFPAHDLFNPNETVMKAGADRRLEPLLAYLKTDNLFKLVLAMHSDDTGSESYKKELTQQRLQAVEDYFKSKSGHPQQISGYALADEEPLKANTTRENRNTNRRLEIFIVPLSGIIQKLK